MKLTRTQLQNLLIEQVLFSEGLLYHVENSIPLYDCIYRPGSKGFFSLISESRTMYNNGLLRVDEDELDMLNSDLGEFALYEGREVALDFPISEEADYELLAEPDLTDQDERDEYLSKKAAAKKKKDKLRSAEETEGAMGDENTVAGGGIAGHMAGAWGPPRKLKPMKSRNAMGGKKKKSRTLDKYDE